VQRLLPALVAIVLLIAGIAALVAAFSSHDAASIGTSSTASSPARGPNGLPVGNIVVHYRAGVDGKELRALASRLSAEQTAAAVAAGQAIVLRHDGPAHGVIADNGRDRLSAPSGSAPALNTFVQQWLGVTR
jgi:hypothetical protein